MVELREDRCENCTDVDRSIDDMCHEVFHVTERCPFFKNLKMYREIHREIIPIELVTGWTGCGCFKLDEKYKKFNEDCERMNKERNEKYAKEHTK